MSDATTLVTGAYAERARVVSAFFEAEAGRLAELCHAMARRFIRGGRLIAFGAGPAATDAQHVSVEFVHPVIVGKRALPALALSNDGPVSLGLVLTEGADFLTRQLSTLARPEDIALGMVHRPTDGGLEPVRRALRWSGEAELLAIGLTSAGADIDEHSCEVFSVASDDPFVVQEVHETLYHVLWELVHVFFEHKGLLEDRPEAAGHDSGHSSFLYPFLSAKETGLDAVLSDISRSIVAKAADVTELRGAPERPASLGETALAIAERVNGGGKILCFGNGGSATDAQDFVVDLVAPPPWMSPVSALSLTNDTAVISAVGNDVGFDNVFARQIIAHGGPNDVAVAISTSGGSRNVLAAVTEARKRGLLTVGFAGYGGGRMAELCDRAHVVAGDYIPRIQEAQASQYHVLRLLLAQLVNK